MKENIFVVQKHDATRLHYDFRLQINNILKSWAIPKEPLIKIGEKRLAIETEDHDLEYADFEGNIPEGSYGAGKVETWDKGKYKNNKEISIEESYNKGQIEVNLTGKKLKGNFALIKANFIKSNKTNNWLFIKLKD
jgi:bifunctional non-homologous end joining protein LigD